MSDDKRARMLTLGEIMDRQRAADPDGIQGSRRSVDFLIEDLRGTMHGFLATFQRSFAAIEKAIGNLDFKIDKISGQLERRQDETDRRLKALEGRLSEQPSTQEKPRTRERKKK